MANPLLFYNIYFKLFDALKRNVTIWPLVQVLSGENVVALVPDVMPFSTAQFTGAA